MTAPAAYLLCTSPRSGSTLLCELLKATGVAGRPGSHFHEPSLARWAEVYGIDPAAFPDETAMLRAIFAAARRRGTCAAGLFGLRMQRGSFGYFLAQARRIHPAGRDAEVIGAAFGPTRFLHLSRADKLAQAVSRVMAEQTGLWHRRADGSELERLAPPAAP
ncbi:MAG: Stf0 family sulfotransferase, partial [Pseudomonadota bacterium]